MEWFTAWWEGMDLLGQTFAAIAIPATILLVLQTVLLLFGVGSGHDVDHGEWADDAGALDADSSGAHDADLSDHDLHDGAHHGAGLRIFTVRGLVAFFSVGGWLGVVLAETGLGAAAVISLAVAGGMAALILTALFLKWSLSLQDEGNLRLENAVGKTAEVYISIPAFGKGTGKITMTLQDRYVELSAMTLSEVPLKPEQIVKVTGVVNDSTLMVRPIAESADKS